MDLAKVVAHLRAELNILNAAIASLEGLQEGGRRVRPPEALPRSGKAAPRRASKAKLKASHGGESSSAPDA
jgi:hypothetical protein